MQLKYIIIVSSIVCLEQYLCVEITCASKYLFTDWLPVVEYGKWVTWLEAAKFRFRPANI